MYELIGTHFSPYTRRIRLAMEGIDHEFIPIDFSNRENYELLIKRSPIGKVPLLVRGDFTLFDSKVIFQYLNENYLQEKIDWAQTNDFTLIDEINDTFLQLLLMKRSAYDIDDTNKYLTNLYRRVRDGLEYLDSHIENFNEWNFVSMSLLCLVDWIEFRELWDLSSYENLSHFQKRFGELENVRQTDPRNVL